MKEKIKGIVDNNLSVLVIYACLVAVIFAGIISKGSTYLSGYDNLTQTYAWLYKQWAAIHNHEIALWDFQPGGGSSFIGELQTAPFYPLNIIFSLVVQNFSLNSVNIYIYIHFVLAAFFMYLCIKEHGRSGASAFIGGIVFSMLVISKRVFAQANIFMAMIWIPLIIVYLKRAYESQKKWYENINIFIAGILLGVSFLAGHMQPFLHNVICVGIWTLFFSKYKRKEWKEQGGIIRNISLLIFAGIICIMAVFGQLVASYEYIARCYRWIGLEAPLKGNEAVPLEAYKLYVIQFKDLINLFDSKQVLIEYGSMYISLLGCILLVVSFIAFRDKLWKFSISITILGLICALGQNSGIGLWICRLPLLSTIREPIRYLYLTNIGTAILAAIGYDEISRCVVKIKAQPVVKETISVVFFAFITCILCVSAYDFNKVNYEKYAWVEENYEETDAIKYLEQVFEDSGRQIRIYNDGKDTLPANIGNVYPELFTTDSQRATLGIDYYDYLCRDWSLSSENIRHLGVKYVISKEQKEIEGFKLVYSENNYYIYEREADTSVFWQVTQDNDEMEVCEGIQTVQWNTNNVSIQGDFDACRFIFSQQNYPGWNVYIDGTKKAVDVYDIFMSVEVPEGEHTVLFKYEPWWFSVWYVYILILLTWFLILLFEALKNRKRTSVIETNNNKKSIFAGY